jgi:SAM-dependent methyltransferase
MVSDHHAACPVCGAESAQFIAPYRARTAVFAGRVLVSCNACGLVYATPMPDPVALDAYNSTYFESAHGGAPTDTQVVAFHSAINGLRVEHVERYIARKRVTVATVLEIGAASGHFARRWLMRYPHAEYHAIESDSTCHEALRRAGVVLHQSAEALPERCEFDLVVMSHVLEHNCSPLSFIRETTGRLRVGGALFIEVPCSDWKFKREDEPHLLFFDKPSLEQLLRQCGFADISVTYHGPAIADTRAHSFFRRVLSALRARLIAHGLVQPFARVRPGLQAITDPLERAVIGPFLAHREQSAPSWWLRAVARKAVT